MFDSKDFDLWAYDYDKSVGLSDDDGTYPFAGYKLVLGEIYRRVVSHAGGSPLKVLRRKPKFQHSIDSAMLFRTEDSSPFSSDALFYFYPQAGACALKD